MLQGCIPMIKVHRRFIAATAGFLCFSLLFGGSLPFRIFYSMLLLLVISYLYIRTVRSVLNVEISCSDTVLNAGSNSNILIKVKFNMPLPVPYVEIYCDAFSTGGSGCSGFFRDTSWDENIWIDSSLKFHQRGIHNLDNVFVKVTDLFHIVSFEKSISTGIRIKVYPRIHKIKPLKLSGIDIYREASVLKSQSEDQHTIKDVRKYREGDSIKKIHWKLSAKQNDLYVKNLDTISGEEIVLFVDMNNKNYSFDSDGTIEENLVDFSVSIANQMIRRNISIKIFLNTSPGRYFELNNISDFNRFMDFLMSQKSNGTVNLLQYLYENTLRLHRMNKIAIVLSELDENLVDALIRMGSTGYSISVFYCVDNTLQQEYSSALTKAQIECFYCNEYIDKKRRWGYVAKDR